MSRERLCADLPVAADPARHDPNADMKTYAHPRVVLALCLLLAGSGVAAGQQPTVTVRYVPANGEALCAAFAALGYVDDAGRPIKYQEYGGGIYTCEGTLEQGSAGYLVAIDGDRTEAYSAEIMAKWNNNERGPQSAATLLTALDTIYKAGRRQPDIDARRRANSWTNFETKSAGASTKGEVQRQPWGYNYVVTVHFYTSSR
jgi:hypothetical protein